jgi:helix-turn-helix protein
MRVELELSDGQLAAIAERVADIMAAREPAAERWLDTKDAADYLSVHPVTLRKLAAERRIDFQQEERGRKLYFSTRELDRHRRGEYGDPIPR